MPKHKQGKVWYCITMQMELVHSKNMFMQAIVWLQNIWKRNIFLLK
jgi:hypothetical protein